MYYVTLIAYAATFCSVNSERRVADEKPTNEVQFYVSTAQASTADRVSVYDEENNIVITENLQKEQPEDCCNELDHEQITREAANEESERNIMILDKSNISDDNTSKILQILLTTLDASDSDLKTEVDRQNETATEENYDHVREDKENPFNETEDDVKRRNGVTNDISASASNRPGFETNSLENIVEEIEDEDISDNEAANNFAEYSAKMLMATGLLEPLLMAAVEAEEEKETEKQNQGESDAIMQSHNQADLKTVDKTETSSINLSEDDDVINEITGSQETLWNGNGHPVHKEEKNSSPVDFGNEMNLQTKNGTNNNKMYWSGKYPNTNTSLTVNDDDDITSYNTSDENVLTDDIGELSEDIFIETWSLFYYLINQEEEPEEKEERNNSETD